MQPSTLESPEAAPTERPVSPQLQDARLFIKTLAGWRDTHRGRLAQLKRNVGEPFPGRGTAWFTLALYEGDSRRRLHRTNEYFLVATLFDLNRFQTERGDAHFNSLGASMRRAVTGGSNEESTGRRLQILLDADFEEGAASELAFRLRQTVQWLAGARVGVDFAQLLNDLCFWSHPDRFIQKQWARDFYQVRLPGTDSAA